MVMNLDSRPDRLEQVTQELSSQGIVFERFPAIKMAIGWMGFNASVRGIFEKYKETEHLFVFEDDCYFNQPFDPSVLDELPCDYDALWLGANLLAYHREKVSDRLHRFQNGWTTHAVLYSRHFRDWILDNWNGELVFDEWIRVNALPTRNCFIHSPMIAFQRSGMSDINNREEDYSSAFELSQLRLR